MKISKIIGIIYKIRKSLTTQALKLIYYGLIYPYLIYGICVWGNAATTHLNKLRVLQKKALRLIGKAEYLAHTNTIFKENKILKLEDIYLCEVLKFMYTEIVLRYGSISIQFVNNIHNRTRNSNNLRPPRCKKEYKRRFISYQGCLFWNELPMQIRESPSILSFKNKIKYSKISNY